jgi:hypothetical protein
MKIWRTSPVQKIYCFLIVMSTLLLCNCSPQAKAASTEPISAPLPTLYGSWQLLHSSKQESLHFWNSGLFKSQSDQNNEGIFRDETDSLLFIMLSRGVEVHIKHRYELNQDTLHLMIGGDTLTYNRLPGAVLPEWTLYSDWKLRRETDSSESLSIRTPTEWHWQTSTHRNLKLYMTGRPEAGIYLMVQKYPSSGAPPEKKSKELFSSYLNKLYGNSIPIKTVQNPSAENSFNRLYLQSVIPGDPVIFLNCYFTEWKGYTYTVISSYSLDELGFLPRIINSIKIGTHPLF